MNPKVTGILLFIVGLGVLVYFVNSGGGQRFGTLLQPPGSSSTMNSTPTSTTSTGTAPGAGAAGTATTTQGFSWATFFQSLFAPHHFSGLPGASGGSGGGGSNGNGSGSGNASGNSANVTVTPPTGYTASQLSPYYHEVRFGGVSSGQITLTTYPTYGTPTSTIDVTGWEIKTNRGGEFIPQAAILYYPIGQSPEGDIILTLSQYQTQYVNFYANSAPINLRLNECLGYLNATRQFNPGFSYSCPAIDRSQISQFTGVCQNYIMSLGNCQSPDFGSYYFPRNDYQCQDYLTGKYNYNWCVSAYEGSPNFFGNEWRVWMGSSPLDPYHDNVELLDRNGLLVDIYSY